MKTEPNKSDTSDVKLALLKASKPDTMIGLKHNDILTVFNSMKHHIASALPKYLTVERFIQIVTTMVNRNPAIQECTPASLIGAVMTSAILGFKPISQLGECYYVPFFNSKTGKKEIQFMIGYKGMIKLAFRNKLIVDIYAETVHDGDLFTYSLGTNKTITHQPSLDANGIRDQNNMSFAYAVVHYSTGGSNFVILNRRDIESFRRRSANQKSSTPSFIWQSDYLAMAKKTAIRRLMTFIPLDDELSMTGTGIDETIIDDRSFMNGELLIPETPFNLVMTNDEPETVHDVHQTESEPPPAPKPAKKTYKQRPIAIPEPPFDDEPAVNETTGEIHDDADEQLARDLFPNGSNIGYPTGH